MSADTSAGDFVDLLRSQLATHCSQALRNVVTQTRGVSAGMIASSDGFEIAAVWPFGDHTGKIAAMMASLLALGTTAGAQAGLRWCQSVVVECEGGKLVVRALHIDRHVLLLGLVAESNATLGSVIYASRHLSNEIASIAESQT